MANWIIRFKKNFAFVLPKQPNTSAVSGCFNINFFLFKTENYPQCSTMHSAFYYQVGRYIGYSLGCCY